VEATSREFSSLSAVAGGTGARNKQHLRLIGKSGQIHALQAEIDRVARSDAKVLITGESGVGKEIVSRSIHYGSPRATMMFAPVNCAGLPETLLESELFGHVKGSFTGAYRDKPGKLESAHMGTVFLDEIGEMTLRMQGLLLRFLETGEIQRVGADGGARHVNVRIIGATHRNLRDMITQGSFREDLYYRLNVVSIEMPPLRERKDDIVPLATSFIRKFSGELKKKIEGLDPDAQKLLMRYNWPGNIRELENAIERAMLLAEGRAISSDDLRLGDTQTVGTGRDQAPLVKIPPTGIALEEIERHALIEALKMSNWVQKDAAELLAISPRVMNYKIKTLGIEFPRGRRAAALPPSPQAPPIAAAS